MRATFPLALVLLLSAADAVPAAAQVIAPPPRSTAGGAAQPATPRGAANQRPPGPRTSGGIFGGERANTNDARTELSTSFNVMGAYESSLNAQNQVTTGPVQSGITGTVGTNLRYRRSKGFDSIEGSVDGFVNTFHGVDADPMTGGSGNFRVAKRLVESTSLNGGIGMSYRPSFTLNSAAPVPGQGLGAGTDPATGVAELASTSKSGQIGVTHQWRRGHSTSLMVTHGRQDHSSTGLDVRSTGVSLGQSAGLTRTLSLQFGYGFSTQTTDDRLDDDRPEQSQTASVGIEYRVPVSRSRQLTFSGGPAVVRVSTVSALTDEPFDYMSPSGYASVRLDLVRTWSLSADFSRASTMLEGLTRQTFMTSSFALSTGGEITSRAMVSASAGYSEGSPHQGDTGSFSGVNGTLQLQYELARWGGFVTNYSYYRHELRDIAAVPAGFPRFFDRHSFRVGLTVWLPLYGTFAGGQRRAAN